MLGLCPCQDRSCVNIDSVFGVVDIFIDMSSPSSLLVILVIVAVDSGNSIIVSIVVVRLIVAVAVILNVFVMINVINSSLSTIIADVRCRRAAKCLQECIAEIQQ